MRDISTVSLQCLNGVDDKLEVVVRESVTASANVLDVRYDLEAIGDILVGSQLDETRRLVNVPIGLALRGWGISGNSLACDEDMDEQADGHKMHVELISNVCAYKHI